MTSKYIYEQTKEKMLKHRKIMLSSDDNVLALRQLMSKLRKEGFAIQRIGEFGNIKGYKLADEPKDKR